MYLCADYAVACSRVTASNSRTAQALGEITTRTSTSIRKAYLTARGIFADKATSDHPPLPNLSISQSLHIRPVLTPLTIVSLAFSTAIACLFMLFTLTKRSLVLLKFPNGLRPSSLPTGVRGTRRTAQSSAADAYPCAQLTQKYSFGRRRA